MNWKDIRDLVDVAIRSGRSKDDFCEEHDIDRGLWYKIKPKGFKWRSIQSDLGVATKNKKKEPEAEFKYPPKSFKCSRQGCEEIVLTDDSLCPADKIVMLETLVNVYRAGFSDADIKRVIGECWF